MDGSYGRVYGKFGLKPPNQASNYLILDVFLIVDDLGYDAHRKKKKK